MFKDKNTNYQLTHYMAIQKWQLLLTNFPTTATIQLIVVTTTLI